MDVNAMIGGHAEFVVEFAKQVFELKRDVNTVFSPLSIAVAMGLAAAGAKGPTLHQILQTCFKIKSLQEEDASASASASASDQVHQFASEIVSAVLADASPLGGPVLSFVNGIWVEKSLPLKPGFVAVARNNYATEPQAVDFRNQPNEVRIKVNDWASELSKQTIQELLPEGSVNENTKLVLANALYFLGSWKKQFDPSVTKEDKFYLVNGEVVQVPMMTTKKKQFIKRVNDCKILRLPYLSGNDKRAFSMYFVLPDKIDGLFDLQKKLDSTFIQYHLNVSQEVDVTSFQLPKFKLSFAVDAPDILKKLGLEKPFSEGADFTEMVDSLVGHQLYISEVFHKGFVEVNEKGTEAAASTAATIQLRSFTFSPMEEDFVADHPFIFVIKEDNTGLVLFIGHVLNPLSS